VIYLSVTGKKKVAVTYKDVKVIFNLKYVEESNKISIAPVTAMKSDWPSNSDAEITL
jgi:hypothetical protein